MSFGILLAVLSAILFGAASPLSKLALESVSPFQLAGLLYLGAALGVAPGLIARRRLTLPWKIRGRSRTYLAGAIACGGVLGPAAILFGLRLGQASSVSLWLNLELVFTALLGTALFHDHLRWNGWLALAGMVGASLLLSWEGGRAAIGSGLLVALACLCWGFDNHLTALIDGITPAESTFWKGLVAGGMNLGIGLAASPYAASLATTAGALTVGVFCYGLSIVLYITAAQRLGATRSQMFFSAAPFFGLGLSVLLLGDRIPASHGMAAVLFALSLALLFAGRHGHVHGHAAVAHEHRHRHDDGHHDHPHPGLPANREHVHEHGHGPERHGHPHWPDLHHRHPHEG